MQERLASSRSRRWFPVPLIALFAGVLKEPALATYHFMQIEQVIGGVEGDSSAQAIQLRMRSAGQNHVDRARLIAWDAAGANPIILVDLDTDVAGDALGERVLIASDAFQSYTNPTVAPDFVLTAAIPDSYLAAGSLTFENDEGTFLVWRVSWGGAGYTGLTTGAVTNDDNGDFGPPFSGPLPTDGLTALRFQGAAADTSTTNAADYALSTAAGVFVNNSGQSFTVTTLRCPNDPQNDADHDHVCGDVDNCPELANPDQSDGDSDGAGDACDDCPDDALKSEPGACGCGAADSDFDGDGAADCLDNCPHDANGDQADRDDDGSGDVCDACADDPSKSERGDCGCGASESDADLDGVADCLDNCPTAPNANQHDEDDDSVGDVCDDDFDAGTGSSGSGDDHPDHDGATPPVDDGSPTSSPGPPVCGIGMLPVLLTTTLLPIVRWRRSRPAT